ncbi:MAG: hypothetical protein K6G40_08650 [Eubacterium sp.]|nr:hypothetical protein [Eubacterium sp.]
MPKYTNAPNIEGKKNDAEYGLDYIEKFKRELTKFLKILKEEQEKRHLYDRLEYKQYYAKYLCNTEEEKQEALKEIFGYLDKSAQKYGITEEFEKMLKLGDNKLLPFDTFAEVLEHELGKTQARDIIYDMGIERMIDR